MNPLGEKALHTKQPVQVALSCLYPTHKRGNLGDFPLSPISLTSSNGTEQMILLRRKILCRVLPSIEPRQKKKELGEPNLSYSITNFWSGDYRSSHVAPKVTVESWLFVNALSTTDQRFYFLTPSGELHRS